MKKMPTRELSPTNTTAYTRGRTGYQAYPWLTKYVLKNTGTEKSNFSDLCPDSKFQSVIFALLSL